jgi:hypothetical protein
MTMHVDPDDLRFKPEDLERRESETDARKRAAKKSPAPEAPIRNMWKVKIQLDAKGSKLHPLFFERAEGWTVREEADGRIIAIERGFGKGSVALLAESADFTNGSSVLLRRLDHVSSALGPFRRIVFDEQHLGLAESGSIMGMARQFRLMGLAFGLALCGALFIWKNAAGFPPPVDTRSEERFSGRTSHAGLITLLKRHVPLDGLAAACWREWLSANGREAPPEIRQRAEAIVKSAGGKPVEAARQIQALLGAKGKV